MTTLSHASRWGRLFEKEFGKEMDRGENWRKNKNLDQKEVKKIVDEAVKEARR